MTQPMHYRDLNAMLNLYDDEGRLQLHKDKEAAQRFFIDHVNTNTVFFHNLKEKLDYLVENEYYEEDFLQQYSFEFIKSLYKKAYQLKYRFASFMGAYKYYTGYTLKTFDGKRYLERYEDRVVALALYLSSGDETLAENMMTEIIHNRYQPATPTFMNAGKASRGELISCFLSRVEDNMNSIARGINAALQLSKRGGGVAFNLTNLRELGAPIKKIQNQASGVVPVMKMFEDAVSYANQLGARDGSCAVYLSAHHMDILSFLDTKRENADEKIRIKTLSIGVVIPDITFELAKENKDMYLFSPYDIMRVYGKAMSDMSITEHYHEMVDNPEIRKSKTNARSFFLRLAELQFESGYPYIMYEDTVNRANPIEGYINMSNLCVAPETRLLTDQGEFPIVSLEGKNVNVWNGEEYSSVDVMKTGENQSLYRVVLSDDRTLDCTEYHKWYLFNGREVRTYELAVGDWLLPYQAPDERTPRQGMVTHITHLEGVSDTYCVNEPKRHMAVFNGILTGNCSEILQINTPSTFNEDLSYHEVGKDISCNLGSLNIANTMDSPDLGLTVNTAIRALTAVSDKSNLESVPPIAKGNRMSHSIGLGQMNLHGYLAREHIHYGSEEGLDFTNIYFYTVAYHAYKASNQIAREKGEVFEGFENSQYADGSYFTKYIEKAWLPKTEKVKRLFADSGIDIPTQKDWQALSEAIQQDGMYHMYLQAIPPTGSISYINNATSSIHPIIAPIEKRKEGKLGLVYYPAPHLNDDNLAYFESAYTIGPEKIIDTYAEATQHVDQGLSLTLFFPDTVTTRDLNKAQIYAWRKGIKTLYYIRIRQAALEGTDVEGCVGCML